MNSGAPQGNTNSARGKLFTDQIRKVLARDDFRALNAIVEKLVDKAMSGDSYSIQAIIDRLEGKPKQAIEHTGDPENPIPVSLVTPEQLEEKIRGLVTPAGVVPEVEGDRG